MEHAMIDYLCPRCREKLSAPPSQAGQEETCPQCGHASKVPEPRPDPILLDAVASNRPPRPMRPGSWTEWGLEVAGGLHVIGAPVLLFCLLFVADGAIPLVAAWLSLVAGLNLFALRWILKYLRTLAEKP
jgi:DNA-directed RNA polymerase subunit RPC12/RpoP